MNIELVCGDPDCTCAGFGSQDVSPYESATDDLVDDVVDRVVATTEDVLKEAYIRGYNDGAREALDNALSVAKTDLNLIDDEPRVAALAAEVVALGEDLYMYDEVLDALAVWAEEVTNELGRFQYLAELTTTVLQQQEARIKELEQQQDSDAIFAEAVDGRVQALAAQLDNAFPGLFENEVTDLGEAVYLPE